MKVVYQISYLLGTEESHTEHEYLCYGEDSQQVATDLANNFEKIKFFLYEVQLKAYECVSIMLTMMNLKNKTEEEIESITQAKTLEIVKKLVDSEIPDDLKKYISLYPKENDYYHLNIGAFCMYEIEVQDE